MARQIVGKVIKPPAGWAFGRDGYLEPVREFSSQTFTALYEWAKAKKYGLEPNLDSHWSQDAEGVYIYARYKVWADSWAVTEKWLGKGTWTVHGVEYSIGKTVVISRGVAYWNQCASCMRGGYVSHMVGTNAKNRKRFCAACCDPCKTDGCPEYIRIGSQVSHPEGVCRVCVPRHRCRWCSDWYPEADVEPISDMAEQYACIKCADKRRCIECRKVVNKVTKDSRCFPCDDARIEKERAQYEKFDADELPKGGSIHLAPLANRPVRVLSIETEVNGDPRVLAETLWKCGVVREPRVQSYGSKCPDTSSVPAFLKYDGSVTGGELISFLMQFDKTSHSRVFLNTLMKMRSLEKLGKVTYEKNCGGHIHIDAHNFSTDNLWRLVTLYNSLEDVIFRLAGAGSDYGHRTLVPGHDHANGGRGYSHPTAKGPWGVRSNAHLALSGQDRMTGLNFVPYFQAARYCVCGAGAENLRSCKCILPKCTIEWRVWNSTGNPRILHAWFAFMQSVHAWADSAKDMTDAEEKEYPPLGWVKKGWENTTSGHKKLALERVRWIFENLVFSDNERDSLLYAFQHTDIVAPPGFWEEMRGIPTPKNRNVKAPRNCVTRPKEIKVSRPKGTAAIKGSANAYANRAAARTRFIAAAADGAWR